PSADAAAAVPRRTRRPPPAPRPWAGESASSPHVSGLGSVRHLAQSLPLVPSPPQDEEIPRRQAWGGSQDLCHRPPCTAPIIGPAPGPGRFPSAPYPPCSTGGCDGRGAAGGGAGPRFQTSRAPAAFERAL